MNISFQGIGQLCATFLCTNAREGQVVKLTSRGTASACSDNDVFCGAAVAVRGDACSVQVAGFVTLPYTGSVPAVGWTGLAANGTGGVKAAEGGRSFLVVDADTTAKTVTFKL